MPLIFVGHDWSEDHHDVVVLDVEGRRVTSARLEEGVDGVARFHALVVDLVSDPGEVVVGTETDRGLFIGALVAAGYEVYAVNPRAVDRYRDRHRMAGGKSDASDAKVLADLVRTDRHLHRPVAADSELGEGIKILGRAHNSALTWRIPTRWRCCQAPRRLGMGGGCLGPGSRRRFVVGDANATSNGARARSTPLYRRPSWRRQPG